jgi:nitrous-oxide reductase
MLAAVALAALLLATACGPQPARRGAGRGNGGSEVAAAALATYVAPGDLDEYYLFYSGGHSGQIFVSGIPSMRHIATIPVFTPYPGTGYGFDDETKEMLDGYSWGDSHHPAFSETGGEYDGRWLFINDNANGRMARIDLRDFKTKQIIKIPNISANHGSSFVSPNTEFVTMATRMSVPFPEGTYADVTEYATKYKGVVAGIAIDSDSGEMKLDWEIVVPPFDYDLGDAGKGPSEGYFFWTCYNSEREFIEGGKLEVTASQKDKDYILMVDWRAAAKAVDDGQASMIKGAPVLDPSKTSDIAWYLPLAKSPHGVDVAPSGRWIIGSGKLSPTTTVFDIEKIKQAIADEDFEEVIDGIPVLTYESVREAEIPVGLGPLHTQFDDRGNAYTSLRRERGGEVEAAALRRHLGHEPIRARQDPRVVQHRSPGDRRGRLDEPRRQLSGGPQQAVEGTPHQRRALDPGVGAADRHQRRQDEAPLRRLHRAGAPLRDHHKGRQAGSDRGLQEGRSGLAAERERDLDGGGSTDRTARQHRRGVDDRRAVVLRSRRHPGQEG